MSENRTRFRLDQRRAPIYEALEQFRQMRVVPFDVPGHKRGRGNPELTAFLGQQCVGVDVNSMKPLDNLCHPVSVIREAEELAADAFGAAHAFLMVGGTTSSVQSMVLTVCKRGDEIILPRNVHRSVLNALVLCGAVPVYVNPEVDKRLGISLGMKREQVAKAIKEHPNAVAVLVNNPTYYGICSDLRAIVKMAHDAGMLCLADEAHGTHFYFGGGSLPVSAMAAGADMASVSMHKSGGSLTQSSLLLIGPNVHPGYVRQIINLTQTTSGSYLLMSSLDISRRNLALRGRQVFHQVADMAEYAREEINAVGGYYAFGKELCNGNSVFDFDTTKLSGKYYFIALLMLLEGMLPFFLAFEGRRPGAREVTLLACLCALGVAGRAAFFMLPQAKPVLALTILAGVALGGESGFLVGGVTMLVSNILFGQGPWTPWQMFGMGIVGFLAGVLARTGWLRRSRGSLCAFGAVSAILIYGGILNTASALMAAGELNRGVLLTYYLAGFPMDCVHGLSTAAFLWLGAERAFPHE